MSAVRAHETASTRVLVSVWSVTVAAAAGGSLPKLLHLNRKGTPALPQASRPAGSPERQLRHQDLVPEEGHKEDHYTGEPGRGDLKPEPWWEERRHGPEQEQGDQQPGQQGGDPP